MYCLLETPARLSSSGSVLRHSRCTPQQNANGRHKALCWQDFDTGIVNSQREREGWMPECSDPTCLSLHLLGGLGEGAGQPPVSSISASAWPHLSPSMRSSVSVARWRSMARRSAGLGPTLQADLTALHLNIHKVTSMEAQKQRPASDPCTEPPAWTGPPAAL